MSYTFSVSYQNVVKKVTCKNTASVNQVAELSAEKFKLASHTNSALTHNGKILDGFTPLRLTGLVNNAKLVLKQVLGPSRVTLKLVGVVDGQCLSQIIEFDPGETLPSVISRFLQGKLDEKALESKFIEISVVRQNVRNSSPEYRQITVGSLVGSSSSAVFRVNIEDREKREQQRKAREENARRSSLHNNNAELMEENITMLSVEKTEFGEMKGLPIQTSDVLQHFSKRQETLLSSQDEAKGVRRQDDSNATFDDQDLPPSIKHIDASKKSKVCTPGYCGLSEGSSKASVNPEIPEGIEDTLYVPKTRSANYENPDEDYELTTNQAETYYKILKSMQGKVPARKNASKPSRYTIRVRFPDRTLLDLHFENPTTKLGQFLKKLDSYLLKQYVNSYHLKSGTPPFQEIQFGFSTNNIALQDHPHFSQEKILLIWESSGARNGPFINPELQRKDLSELPTVILETRRGDLEANEVPTRGPKRMSDRSLGSDETNKSGTKGMPKWFRP